MKKNAAALKYQKGDRAPKVVAKGKDAVADIIINIAKKNNIHIEQNKLLCDALMELDNGDYIPEEFYTIVAEVLAFVYKLNLDK